MTARELKQYPVNPYNLSTYGPHFHISTFPHFHIPPFIIHKKIIGKKTERLKFVADFPESFITKS
ncbi:MAG: hypothetical protein EA394_06955, partial [Bacteroidia bacterium]